MLRGNNYKRKKNSYWNNLPKREFDIEFARKQEIDVYPWYFMLFPR